MISKLISACVIVCVIAQSILAADLSDPVPILVGNSPIDIEHTGHAAPFVGDFDGDGVNDLLVGEFYKGRLRIYRNVGTNNQPILAKHHVFKDGLPSGCIYAS